MLGIRTTLCASAAFTLVLSATPAAAQDAPPAEQTGEDIVVTAQKREETLIEIPQSISVVSGDRLERQQATSFQDYIALVPGLSLEGDTPGVNRISLRGINTGGVASTVGVYLDEVPFGSSSGLANGAILSGDFDTFDVARLEVLRGPQGTLYGASSLGGVIKFISNPPRLDAFEAKGQATVETVEGGGLGYAATGVVNIPIGSTVAIRASGFYRFDDGFIDTIGNNPIASLTNPDVNLIEGTRVEEEVNRQKTFGGRVSALFKPSDTFSLRLSAMAQNIESDASNYFEADPVTLKPLYGGPVVSQYHPEFTDIKYRVYSGTVDWDLGFASLVSSTSYSTFNQNFQVDPAFLLAQTVSLLAELGPDAAELGLPVITDTPITRPLSAIQVQTTATKKFTQELRLASPDSDSFEWLVGAYYTHEKSAIDPQQIIAVEAETETPVPGLDPLANIFLRSEYEEIAGFANATWHLTPRFDVTFGGRLGHNTQLARQLIEGPLAGGRVEFEDARSSETVFTWSVAPRFEINDDVAVYARVATGYRPGGPNVLPPLAPTDTPLTYDSDTLTSYEVGLKGEWLDRTFSLDIAAFYLDWKDIQLFAFVNDIGINANGGAAISKGFEFTAAARPTQGFTISLTGAYTDAYLTDDTDPVVGGLDGDPLPYIPNWTFGVSGDYQWTVGPDTTAFIGTTLGLVGDRTADFSERGPNGDIRKVPSYTTLDLRAGIETDRWRLQAFAKNLTNSLGITSINGLDGTTYPNAAAGVGVIRPRTIGLTAGFSF